ncbi:MAG: DegT/DnrJ/EryC1/StrS family aminotransferase [Candidatus Helarchaeota archaeon]
MKNFLKFVQVQKNSVINEEFSKVCSSSDFMLSLNTYNNIPDYFSNRLLRYMGCGTCVLHFDPTKTLHKYFDNVLFFSTDAELLDLIENTSIEKAGELAFKAREEVMNAYTWDHTIQKILFTMVYKTKYSKFARKKEKYRIQFSKPDVKLTQDDMKKIQTSIESGWFCNGKYVQELEKHFRDKFKVKYAIACSNCTSGLIIAFKVLDIKNKDVAIPVFTWPSTLFAIECNENYPIFRDNSCIHLAEYLICNRM